MNARQKVNKLVQGDMGTLCGMNENGAGMIMAKEDEDTKYIKKESKVSYDEYVQKMQKIAHFRKKLVEVMALKRKSYTDYNEYRKLEKEMRDKLIDSIPAEWS